MSTETVLTDSNLLLCTTTSSTLMRDSDKSTIRKTAGLSTPTQLVTTPPTTE